MPAWEGEANPDSVPMWEPRGIVAVVGMSLFAFAGHPCTPSIYATARRPNQFTKVTSAAFGIAAVYFRVERFDRRGTEPFELFRSEFGQNSFKIQEFSLEKL